MTRRKKCQTRRWLFGNEHSHRTRGCAGKELRETRQRETLKARTTSCRVFDGIVQVGVLLGAGRRAGSLACWFVHRTRSLSFSVFYFLVTLAVVLCFDLSLSLTHCPCQCLCLPSTLSSCPPIPSPLPAPPSLRLFRPPPFFLLVSFDYSSTSHFISSSSSLISLTSCHDKIRRLCSPLP